VEQLEPWQARVSSKVSAYLAQKERERLRRAELRRKAVVWGIYFAALLGGLAVLILVMR